MRRGLFGSRYARDARRGFERLEDRTCLSVTVATLTVHGQQELRIVGDETANTVAIVDDGNGHVEVSDGDGNLIGSGDDIDSVRFVGKNGQDVVSYTLTAPLVHDERIFLQLGAGGENQASLDLSQGVDGANLHVTVVGGPADDTISATLGAVSDGHASIVIDGRAGDDTISVIGAAADIAADSALALLLDGGRGSDTLTTTLDSQVLGHLHFSAWGGPGDDTIASELTANLGSTGGVFAKSAGGPGTDDVTLNVNDNSGEEGESALAAVHAAVFDPDGEDTLTHTDNVVELERIGRFVGFRPHGRGGPGRFFS